MSTDFRLMKGFVFWAGLAVLAAGGLAALILRNVPPVPDPPRRATPDQAAEHLDAIWAVAEPAQARDTGWRRETDPVVEGSCSIYFLNATKEQGLGRLRTVWRTTVPADPALVVLDLRQAFDAAGLEFFYDGDGNRLRGVLLEANDEHGYRFRLTRDGDRLRLTGSSSCLHADP